MTIKHRNRHVNTLKVVTSPTMPSGIYAVGRRRVMRELWRIVLTSLLISGIAWALSVGVAGAAVWYTAHACPPADTWAVIAVAATPIGLLTAIGVTLARTLQLLCMALGAALARAWDLFSSRPRRDREDDTPILWI